MELGGWNDLYSWTNPPPSILCDEVDRHADFAVAQALAAPCIEIGHCQVEALGDDTWRVTIGVANTGWLPTTVSSRARLDDMVRPITADVFGAEVLDGAARRTLGQLLGASSARFTNGTVGTPDRVTCSWLVRGTPGAEITVTVQHQRAGQTRTSLTLSGTGAS